MIVKMFEVLDRATCIPVIVVRLEGDSIVEQALLGRRGLGKEGSFKTMLAIIGSGYVKAEMNYERWTESRTLNMAHAYIDECFDTLDSGAVIDVEFLLKEVEAPRKSELIIGDLL